MRLLCLVALLAAAGAAAQPATPAPTAGPALPALVELAWQLGRQASLGAARQAALDARALASRFPFAGPPTLGLDLRRDLPPGLGLPGTATAPERGKHELEPGVSVPLWLPGQRAASQQLIARERGQLDAEQQARRWRLAGEVREAAWALALAGTELRVQQARLDSARALQADVERRVAAGDLAPSDGAQARAEALAAQAGVLEAGARQGAAAVTLQQLTGSPAAGSLDEPAAPDADLSAHPLLRAARDAVQAARARLDLDALTRRDNPTVSAAARFDRDAAGNPWRNTLRVGISLPLDTDARNAPRLAAASAALAEAEVELQQREREVQAGIARARLALDGARAALAAHTGRAAAAAQARDAIARAFAAGERSLAELLRVRGQALDAELARDAARDQLGLAQARLHHALGVTP